MTEPLIAVSMTKANWDRVMTMIASKNTWVDCNDVLMIIGQQVQAQVVHQQTNSQEVPAAVGEVVSSRAN